MSFMRTSTRPRSAKSHPSQSNPHPPQISAAELDLLMMQFIGGGSMERNVQRQKEEQIQAQHAVHTNWVPYDPFAASPTSTAFSSTYDDYYPSYTAPPSPSGSSMSSAARSVFTTEHAAPPSYPEPHAHGAGACPYVISAPISTPKKTGMSNLFRIRGRARALFRGFSHGGH
ncbi:hypothetical protein GYMLUDRAFT_49102 [Collybiopsis luxurians FD-317 M1]|uniref:Uncharacterized protein n=1 Tax=Collybiopsis luxurians FD-317 M1 TaxID=944289 RepID=A0A0D0ATU9_9AGAR|nr:hypothetical protein GYMLUDRAFT_49102 [Collybiopsis luxurians FD-317 M1]